jgi:subtilisin-like proprotein convertase family protein
VAAGTFDKLRVTFSEAINTTTFTFDDVGAFTLNGNAITGLTYTVTPVSGTNNQFDISFAAQSALGTYAMTIGPAIADLAGNNMSAAYTATGTLSATTTTTFNSVDVPKTIPDVATTTSVLSVGQSQTITKITVKLNLNHTYDSDLKITLKSPAGTTVLLANRRGGSGDNYTNTVFDSSAATSIASGFAPFSGTYRPEQSLTAFNGQNASGTWSLIIQDVAFLDSGRLNSWSITITSNPGGNSVEEPSGPDTGRGFAVAKFDAVIVASLTPQAPLAEAAHSTVSAPAAVQAENPLFDRAFAVRQTAADAGFVAVGATHTDAGAAADWLSFDAGELADGAADVIDVG